MPRSGGIYSLPSGYLAKTGEKVLASQHNGPLEDLAASMTNSLPRDGQAPMLGDLPMGGKKITNLAVGTANSDAATVAQVNGAVPIGALSFYAGATTPSGWLLCYGQAVSRTTYAALFSAIGATFGSGDGTTTFNIPDARDIAFIGRGNMGGTAKGLLSKFASTVLGSIFGVQEHALTKAQLAPHNHPVNDPGHGHTYSQVSNDGGRAQAGGGQIGNGQIIANTSTSSTGITVGNEGSGEAHPNVQPSMAMNVIIKAL